MRITFLLAAVGCHIFAPVCVAQRISLASTTPTLDIRAVSDDGEIVFERAIGGTRLSNGRVIVADALATTLRVFDARGRSLKTVGRRGGGPGEFQDVTWVGQCGRDSVMVWDRRRAKLSVVNAAGDIIRESTAPFPPTTATRLLHLACSRAGSYAYVTLPDDTRPTRDGIVRGPATLVLVTSAGVATTLPAHVSSTEMIVRGGGGMPRPLGRQTSVVALSDRVIVGTADSASVDVYSLNGQRIGTIAVSGGARGVTDAQYDRAIDRLTELVPPAVQARVEQMLRQVPSPEQIPPYTSLLSDSRGLLWVLASGPGDDHTHLEAVDLRGRRVGGVRIPVALEVWEIGEDYILGQYSDADAEPHIVVYRILRQ